MKCSKSSNKVVIIKGLSILLMIILLVFVIINTVWYFGYQQRYNSIAKHLDATYLDDIKEPDRLRYTKEIGDYTITMKMPSYLGSGGFVSVAPTVQSITILDEQGNIIGSNGMCVTLFIWPKYFSDYKIGLDFYDEMNCIAEQIEFTSDMEIMHTDTLDDAYIEYINLLMSEYADEIINLIYIAEEVLETEIVQSYANDI